MATAKQGEIILGFNFDKEDNEGGEGSPVDDDNILVLLSGDDNFEGERNYSWRNNDGQGTQGGENSRFRDYGRHLL